MKLYRRTHNLLLIMFALMYLSLIIWQMQFGAGARETIKIFGAVIFRNSVNGVLQGLELLICIILVCVDFKRGAIASYCLMLLSALQMLGALVGMNNFGVVPGLVNLLIGVGSVTIISRQFRKRELDIVTDFLTGLRNRRGLELLLENKTGKSTPFNVLYLDLDNFKYINDSLGHKCGDITLKIISKRLKDLVGKNGDLSRIGGDEFVLVLNDKVDPEKIANEIVSRVSEKVVIQYDGTVVDWYLSVYVGIARYPEDTKDKDMLIKYADIAMYAAAKSKTIRVMNFNKQMENEHLKQAEIEKYVKEALQKDFFYMVYQPQFGTQGKKLRGFESLIRLKSSDGRMISPADFIAVAERSDLIFQIDEYVIDRVLREFCQVVKTENTDLIISINVSAKNIARADFVGKLKEKISQYEFPPKCLEIEITEYCLSQSVDITINNINEMRAMGIHIALDDFGTGYSSLSYLYKLPINLLKIDKSLIDEIEVDEKKRDFAKTVISLGHLMGCKVISEGVEMDEQLEILRDNECDFIQGYIWGKPMEYSNALNLCKKYNK